MKLVLASSSPRRLDLLKSISILPTQIISPDINETPYKEERIGEYVKRIACLKARAVQSLVTGVYILAADTAVEAGHQIFLKPETADEARKTLEYFSGRRHRIKTGVCVISPEGKESIRVVTTRISFKRLTQDEIEDYIHSGEWEGKAGSYSIQGKAAKFVKFISGSYTNVVGLPLYETDALLKGLGFRG